MSVIAALREAVDARAKYDVLTVNAHRSEAFSANWSAFGGVGVGIGRVTLPGITLDSGCKCFSEASKTKLVYQARIGAEYRLSETGFGFVQVGYLRLPGAAAGGASAVTYPKRGIKLLSLGYRGHFK